MKEFASIKLHEADGVATLTLNEPATRNAMSEQLTRDFSAAIDEIARVSSIRGLIITGAGSAFCAGGDLAMLTRMLDQSPDENRREMGLFYRAYLHVLDLDIPTLAAINGAAIGAGLAFTLGCDLRIAVSGAKLGITFLNLGLYPGMGSIHLLSCVVGASHAADLVLSGRIVAAEEALRIGLVSRVVAPEALLDDAHAMMREMVAKPAAALRMAKRALAQPKQRDLEAALDHEATAQMTSYASPEMRATLERLAGARRR